VLKNFSVKTVLKNRVKNISVKKFKKNSLKHDSVKKIQKICVKKILVIKKINVKIIPPKID